MNTHKEYRDSILNKLDSYLAVVHENIELQEETSHNEAMGRFITTLGRLVNTVKEVKDDQSFVGLTKGIEQLLNQQFFSQIHKKPVNPLGPANVPKSGLIKEAVEKQNAPVKDTGLAPVKKDFICQGELHMMTDPDEIPMEVRVLLADHLKTMGIPESQIKSQLKLGGNE